MRRGSEQATIYSVAFEHNEKWLACSSDSGTIHIFALKPLGKESPNGEDEQESKNKKSKLSILKVFNSYFDSEWSFAQYKCQDKRTKVAFLSDPHNLAIASTEVHPTLNLGPSVHRGIRRGEGWRLHTP